MQIDKPLIAILMAIYEPNMAWLRDQLISLNSQTYTNLKLYIRDDCSPTVPYEQIEACVRECITAFPCEMSRNEQNLGSNKSFELMTKEAEGEYIAYCDQDDIWMPEKLERYLNVIESEHAELVCSDMYIIDGDSKQIVDSITKTRRHHIFRSGKGLYGTLWYSNFASGCALLVRAETARKAVPFNPYMFYDHYVTLIASTMGKIAFIPEPLIKHREHGSNQSGGMPGVHDRESYITERVEKVLHAVEWNLESVETCPELTELLKTGKVWMDARLRYMHGDRSAVKTVWEHRKFSPMACMFELISPVIPNAVFMAFVELSKRNII